MGDGDESWTVVADRSDGGVLVMVEVEWRESDFEKRLWGFARVFV